MDKYQQEIYNHYETIEEQLERHSKTSKIYRAYTRQTSNFATFKYLPLSSEKLFLQNYSSTMKAKPLSKEAFTIL